MNLIDRPKKRLAGKVPFKREFQQDGASNIRDIYVLVDVVRPHADEGIVIGTYNQHPDSQALIFVPGQVKLHFVDHGEGGTLRLQATAWRYLGGGADSVFWKGDLEVIVPPGGEVTIPVTQQLRLVAG